MNQDRLRKLAQHIEALAKIDEQILNRTREIEESRRHAAIELHAICAGFVNAVNQLLTEPAVRLDPPEYRPDFFNPEGPNLLQINVRGRILQIEFQATDQLISTENFRAPYIVEGAVRSFDQPALEREAIEEQLLFYCIERRRNVWRFFDGRTYRTGLFDEDYLIQVLEMLV